MTNYKLSKLFFTEWNELQYDDIFFRQLTGEQGNDKNIVHYEKYCELLDEDGSSIDVRFLNSLETLSDFPDPIIISVFDALRLGIAGEDIDWANFSRKTLQPLTHAGGVA